MCGSAVAGTREGICARNVLTRVSVEVKFRTPLRVARADHFPVHKIVRASAINVSTAALGAALFSPNSTIGRMTFLRPPCGDTFINTEP